MKKSRLHSLIKAFSWRIFATGITMIISYLITHKISFAIYIGTFEFISKIIFFYLHERIWETISLQRKRTHVDVKINSKNPVSTDRMGIYMNVK